MTKPKKKDLTPTIRSLFGDHEFRKLLKKFNVTDSEADLMFTRLTAKPLIDGGHSAGKPSSVKSSDTGVHGVRAHGNKDLNIESVIVFVDGASRGNNIKGAVGALAGAGAFITDKDGNTIKEARKFLGAMTNNGAEYSALVLGLKEAAKLGAKEVRIIADSELMVKQMKGIYKVKSPNIKSLYNEAKELSQKFAKFSIKHTLRENNKDADRLANESIDCRTGRG